jgi:DNA-directed RNA polymerase specialized sigma24 family protein
MNRRTCACGTAIFCADLDGYPTWLDQHPDGWISVDEYGRAHISDGGWRRHTCTADPQPICLDADIAAATVDARRLAPLNEYNSQRLQTSARQSTAAAATVLDAGVPLSRRQRAAALARLHNPDASLAEIGAAIGASKDAVRSALDRVRAHAERITQPAA